jgi:hypothetical protein
MRPAQHDINPALPIGPEDRPSGVSFVINAILLEAVGQIPTHLWHWPTWIGLQLPIAYLLWKISEERAARSRLIAAWNSRFEQPRTSQPSETGDDILKRMMKPRDDQP